MSRDIGKIEQQARRAGYQDGLLELFAAGVLFVIALGWIANPGFVGILAAFIVLYGWKLFDRVKARVTYPRIGYSRERADEPQSSAWGMLWFIAGAFLLAIVVIALSGGLAEPAEWRRAAPLISGMTLSGGFWYAAEQSGLARYRLVAALAVLLGVLLWLVGSGEDYSGVVWHLLGLAGTLALLGTWALVTFVRSHPIRELDADG
ncbi:MAG: hypothetical protein QNJ75_13545 [Acidimicrobiia bacterium]|nr:hypothetical protein [Acidimicrobiia bacterium]